MCDKIVENTESFNINLALINNDTQVGIGRDRSVCAIRDTTGK